jgi:beta-galactosidase/beta-glucuronidase
VTHPPLQQPRPEYPRPQLRRDRWTSLNGEWAFGFDDARAGLAQRWFASTAAELAAGALDQRIVVPFAPQSKLSGIGSDGRHDVVWYARTISRPDNAKGTDRILLHIGAADYAATVWVDGIQVAEHRGGHTPFSADITDAMGDGVSTLVVRVEDDMTALDLPRGKQYWLPQSASIFYTPTTGIWQSVWLEPVSPLHLTELHLTPNVDSGVAELELSLAGNPEGARIELRLSFRGEVVRTESLTADGARTDHTLTVRRLNLEAPGGNVGGWNGVALWSPEQPDLYDLRITVYDSENQVVDELDSYFGMRSVEARDGRVFLNGRPYFQRLVLDQGYFPGGVLTAASDDELRRDIELAKELGFNGARKHQKVEDPRWLYWADRLGFLVWGEMANAYAYSRDYVGRITSEWTEVLRRDHNHPCIIAWTPMNESWAVPQLDTNPQQRAHLRALYHLTKSLDSSRLVISNDGWQHAETDLLTLHDYRVGEVVAVNYRDSDEAIAAEAASMPAYVPGSSYGGEPILITEFGGVAFAVDGGGWGYTTAETSDDFLKRYRDLVEALVNTRAVQGFCYTQLTDVEQEINGLLTFDRVPKVDLAQVKEITSLPAHR